MDDRSQGKGLGMHRLWSHPFTPEVRGGLRGKMNQYSDPSGNILTPKKAPTSQRRGRGSDFSVIPIDPEVEPDPPVCIPPVEDALFQEGGTIPTLQLGDNIVVQSESANGITAPVFYQWTLNGVPTVTTATYPYTVVDGDIQGKDEEGIGYIEFTQTVSNACGLVTNIGSFPAQGTPPP